MSSPPDGRKIVIEVRSPASRQLLVGKKARKEVSKKRAKSLAELVSENDELKRTQNTHDDQLVEVDLELQETKIALAEALAKIDVLEKEKEIDCIAHDDWVAKVYRCMSSEGRKEFRNAFTVAAPSLLRGTISRLRKTTKLRKPHNPNYK